RALVPEFQQQPSQLPRRHAVLCRSAKADAVRKRFHLLQDPAISCRISLSESDRAELGLDRRQGNPTRYILQLPPGSFWRRRYRCERCEHAHGVIEPTPRTSARES